MVTLSICIPTFNRYKDLENSLNSLVCQKEFLETESIEIIICDNQSTDKTQEISMEFCEKFPSKIFYFQNSTNLGPAKNLEKCLTYGKGIFLKISNDTNIFFDGALRYILNLVRKNNDQTTTLFFANGLLETIENTTTKSLNEFINIISFYSTWIVGFGIYKSQLKQIRSFKIVEESNLIVDILFQNIIRSKKVVIANQKIISINNPKVKSGFYNFYEVFVTNYLQILKSYQNKGFISKRTMFIEKHKLFVYHIIPFSIAIFITKRADFGTKNWIKIILGNYTLHPVLYYGLPLFFLIKIIKKIERG